MHSFPPITLKNTNSERFCIKMKLDISKVSKIELPLLVAKHSFFFIYAFFKYNFHLNILIKLILPSFCSAVKAYCTKITLIMDVNPIV